MPPFSYITPGIPTGTVGSGNIAPASVLSGNLASGIISNIFLVSGGLVSGALASGSISNPFITSGGLGSGAIGSGQIGQFHHSSGSVNSGHVASGVWTSYSRGFLEDSFTADELLSGFCPVAFSSGNRLVVAQGGSGLRMPAWGVAIGNFVSGSVALIATWGKLPLTSGIDRLWSGQIGKPLFVSTSGDLITPTLPLAATLAQEIGVAISGGIYVLPNLILASGSASLQSGAV